jgi:hypothetical protein
LASGEPSPEADRPGHQPETGALLQKAALLVSLAVLAAVFYAALRALGPDSQALPTFNSDSAVPVLMSNETHWDIFHAFYFGQDRFGSWPFFLAHLLGTLLQRPVTPEFLHVQSILVLVGCALPVALLAKPWPGLALLAYTVCLLIPDSRGSIFEAAQPYPWQLSLLFWAWWCIRSSWKARGPWPHALWLSAAALVCFLATWTSALSGPLLFGVTLLEGLNREVAPAAQLRRRLVVQLLPALFGMAAEAVLRANYHRFVRAHYQRHFGTRLSLDWGHFADNTRSVWLGLERPTILAALAVLVAYATALFLERRAARQGFRLSGLQCTVLGAWLLALLPLPVLALVRHVRMNDFSVRYFALTYVFLVFGSLLAVFTWLPSRRKGPARDAALLVGTLGLSALALVLLPRVSPNPEYARMQRTAGRLAEAAPGELLLDSYWGTYVFAALVPPGAILPLPRSGDLNRIPRYEQSLPSASRVVVGHREFLGGPVGEEPRRLFQYGTLLELEDAHFLSDGVDRFSTYRPRPSQSVPFRAEPALEGLDLTERGAEVTVSAEAGPPGTVLAVELSCLALVEPPSGWAQNGAGEKASLVVEAMPGAVLLSTEAGVPLQSLHLWFGRQPCRIAGAHFFPRL